MDSCEAIIQTLVVYSTAGVVQKSTKPTGATATAATVPSTTAMWAGSTAATVAATATTAMGTK